MGIPTFDEDYIFGVNFDGGNDAKFLKDVRHTAKNTMKLATDWDDSYIKKEIEQSKKDWVANKNAEEDKTDKAKVEKSTPKKIETTEPEIDFCDDIPF